MSTWVGPLLMGAVSLYFLWLCTDFTKSAKKHLAMLEPYPALHGRRKWIYVVGVCMWGSCLFAVGHLGLWAWEVATKG